MKRGFIIVLLLLFCGGLRAQDGQPENEKQKTQKPKLPCMAGHYLTAEGGFGLQTMTYDLLQNGDVNNNFYSFDIKAGYRYYFHPNFGAGFGLRFQNYTSEATLDYVQYIEGVLDFYTPPRKYQHRTVYDGYTERQNVLMTEFPVELFMQFSLARRLKLNLGGGLQATLFSIANKYKNTSGVISTRAYYEQWKLELQEIERYQLYEAGSFTGNYKYDVAVSAIGELGLLYALNSRLELALNFHLCYGLTKAMKNYSAKYLYDPGCELEDDQTFPSYEPVYNSLLATQAKNVKFMSAGADFGIRFRICKKDPEVALEFDESLGRARRLKQTEDEEFNLMDSLDDGRVKRRNRRGGDTLDIAQKERKRRQIEDDDFYITPSGDTVWTKKPDVDTTEKVVVVEPEKDTVVVVPEKDTVVVIPEKDTVVVEPEKDTVVVVPEKDTVVVVPEKDTVVVVPKKDTVAVVEKDITKELNALIKNLNSNACEFNQTNPKNRKKQSSDIDKLANLLKENPDVMLESVGHTCDIGSVEANKEVGLRRAEYIKEELVSRGVPAKQIRCSTKWFTEPLVPNTSEANRMKNRRYELKVIKK